MKRIINLFEAQFFPLRIGNLALFAVIWLMCGFTLGTATLNGPVRWVANLALKSGWQESSENLVVKLIIVIYVAISFFVSLWLTGGILKTAQRHVRLGIPGILLMMTAGALFYWLNPQMFGSQSQTPKDNIGSFTFGPYPTPGIISQLKSEGYVAIISLLHPAVVPFEPKLLADEKENTRVAGIPLIHLPMLPWVSENTASLDSLKTLAAQPAGKYYVHCYLGRDRVGVAKRLISSHAGTSVVDDIREDNNERRISENSTFERGPVVRLDEGVYLTPYPTNEEYFIDIVASNVNFVVNTLDSTHAEDQPWIANSRQILQKFQIPHKVQSIKSYPYDPENVLRIARELRRLPRPLVVHGFLTRGPRWEGLIQAYRSDLPPLPPSGFKQPLRRGKATVIAPNVASGPRPSGSEFGGLLFGLGVRKFVYLGEPATAVPQEDSTIAAGAGISWQSFNGSAAELAVMLGSGGPWYLYGPRASRYSEEIHASLLPAIPDSIADNIGNLAQMSTTPDIDPEMSKGVVNTVRIFISRAVPDLFTIIIFSPVFLLYTVLAAALAGWLRSKKAVRTPYTRKVFHLFIFTFASVLQFAVGLSAVTLFGSIVCLAVIYAMFRGDGFAFYEAMARPSDAPHRSMFILIPMITTALGGVVANLFFYQYAFVGYLVGGWGDAVGEPVGTRWGKHKYRVPSLAGVPATRSLEGSAAVVIVGFLVAFAGLVAFGTAMETALHVAAVCAIAGAAVEAVSNHGLDNFTIQVAAAGVAYLLLV